MFHMDVLGHFPFNAYVNYLRSSFECSRYLPFIDDTDAFRSVNLLELVISLFYTRLVLFVFGATAPIGSGPPHSQGF